METRGSPRANLPDGAAREHKDRKRAKPASHSTGGQEAVVPTWDEPDKGEERETIAKPTITCPTKTGSQLGVGRQCSTTDTHRAFI